MWISSVTLCEALSGPILPSNRGLQAVWCTCASWCFVAWKGVVMLCLLCRLLCRHVSTWPSIQSHLKTWWWTESLAVSSLTLFWVLCRYQTCLLCLDVKNHNESTDPCWFLSLPCSPPAQLSAQAQPHLEQHSHSPARQTEKPNSFPNTLDGFHKETKGPRVPNKHRNRNLNKHNEGSSFLRSPLWTNCNRQS